MIRKYSTIVILTLTILIGIFNNIPSFAQEDNQTQQKEKADATKEAPSSEEKEYNQNSTVRDSVTILLQDAIIPGTDFIHLYDSTPSHIMNGHIALKVPCTADSNSTIQVLIGSAPNMTATTLENIPALSTPGEQCLYHVDLIPGGNVTTITDIALKNPTEDEIEFPPTSSVVIGINEVMKGEHAHTEDVQNTTISEHTE
ncbi:MAG TPA: hypothetical protein VFU79_05105 [Nitrososphaeraceae archaeon]|nr:hypothetical protein [Nitrososphaeraceae archaeon]